MLDMVLLALLMLTIVGFPLVSAERSNRSLRELGKYGKRKLSAAANLVYSLFK